MLEPNIKNVIFDLGGVILNLSVETTLQQFAALSGLSPEQVRDIHRAHPEFLTYEAGLMSSQEFRNGLRTIFDVDAPDEVLDECWNAMLGELPVERLHLLQRLKSKYKTYLLSNTNEIHLARVEQIVHRSHGITSLDPVFHKAYYSHLLKLRKPDPAIYQHVLNENGLRAEETIFLDDSLPNLKGAASIGIQTFHVTTPDDIFPLFA